MAEYRLHCMKESGNSYKAALMLQLAGCDWQPVWVDYFNGATRQEDFRQGMNEMGEVPILEHGDRKVTQSGAILTYLADRIGKFGGRNDDEKLEILRWMLFDNHKFTSYYATLRFLFGIQKSGDTPVTEFLRARAIGAFGIVERHLADRPFLLGDRLTIADFQLAAMACDWRRSEMPLDGYRNIVRWLDGLDRLPAWADPWPAAQPAGRDAALA